MMVKSTYPLPNPEYPLLGVRDCDMVKYWLDNGLLDKNIKYIKSLDKNNIDIARNNLQQDQLKQQPLISLYHQAETAEILILLDKYQIENVETDIYFCKYICDTITLHDILQTCEALVIPLTSFCYNLPDGTVYYRIIDLLQSICTYDDVKITITKYKSIYRDIVLLISTLPSQKEYIMSSNIYNNIRIYTSRNRIHCLYQDYLICTNYFNTYHNKICQLFFDYTNEILEPYMYIIHPMRYNKHVVQYIINNKQYITKKKENLFAKILMFLKADYFKRECLDLVLYSNVLDDILPLLHIYVELDDINTVKAIIDNHHFFLRRRDQRNSNNIQQQQQYNNNIDNKIDEKQDIIPLSLHDNVDILHKAQSQGMINLLITYNADINKPNKEGYYPIHTSIRSLEVFKSLLCRNADINVYSQPTNKHPLHCMSSMSSDVLQFIIPLLSTSYNYNNSNNDNTNCITNAVSQIDDEDNRIIDDRVGSTQHSIGLPLDVYNNLKQSLSSISINIQDKSGYTPLIYAMQENPIYLSYLLQCNATPHIYYYNSKDNIKLYQSSNINVLYNNNSSNNNHLEPFLLTSLQAASSRTTSSHTTSSQDCNSSNHNNTYIHYIDNMITDYKNLPSPDQLYHIMYNILQSKSYPILYHKIDNGMYMSWLMYSIHKKHIKLLYIYLQYLIPINYPFYSHETPVGVAIVPLLTALGVENLFSGFNYPNIDIIWGLLQYGAICDISKLKYIKNRLLANIVGDVLGSIPEMKEHKSTLW